ncbi:hypothetical protein [Agrococcus jejuensis]|uniref:hypothetical protein n=1 Tax=Agrococcus jejuensis TaxID=399736 RepID=UPI0011A590F1|nr:hypothetical protein [Agrococcus jejuensis]
MPASVPGSPAPRSPGLALLVEQVARVVARARAQQGDAAVQGRVDEAISPEDAATAARVLRTLGRELGETPLDLGALDARLRSIAGDAAGTGDAATGETPVAEQPKPGRPVPPTGLRSAMRGRRG